MRWLHLLGIVFCIAISGCRSSIQDVPEGDGYYTWFAARINGYVWRSETIDAPSLPSLVAVRDANGRFSLEAYRSLGNVTQKMILNVAHLGVGTWTLYPSFEDPYQTAEFVDGSTFDRYSMSDFDSGYLRITSWDATRRLVSGTFEFSATNNRFEVIYVTMGEFANVRYIQQ